MTALESLRSALCEGIDGGPGKVCFMSGFRHVLGVGRSCPWHAHAALELVFHPTGRGSTRLEDGRTVAFGPGAVVLYPPQQGHDQTMEVRGVDVCLQLDIRRCPPLTAGLLLPTVSTPRLRREFEDLAAVHVLEDPLRRAELDHRAAALLYGLTVEPLTGEDHATRARDLIARDYATIGSIAEVARRLAIGEDHLRHLFTARYNTGPGHWLLAVRVDRARDLLVRSRLPLADVAEACGFRSAQHLGAAFRRANGTSPMRWRRQYAPEVDVH